MNGSWQVSSVTGCTAPAADPGSGVNGSLETLGRCLDIDGDGTAAGTKVELWDCNGSAAQQFALS